MAVGTRTEDGPRQASTVLGVLREDRIIRLAAAASVAWVLCYVVAIAVIPPDTTLSKFVSNILYLLPMIAATATFTTAAVVRARARRRRGVAIWGFLAAGALSWTAGEVIWVVYDYRYGEVPYPSMADACYVLSYALTLPGLTLAFGRGHWQRRQRLALDAVLFTLGIGVLGWYMLVTPQLEQATDAAGMLAALYPVCDLAVLVCLTTLGLSGRYRLIPALVLVGAAYVVIALEDAVYTYLTVHSSFTDDSWVNAGFQAAWAMLAVGGLIASRGIQQLKPRDELSRDLSVLPLAVAAIAAAGAVFWLPMHINAPPVAIVSAVVLGLGLLLRQHLITRERTGIARQLRESLVEQERLAITDPLTGLHNRRYFQEMLDVEVTRAARTGHPLSVVLLDLDRFKRINDGYGHAAGDAVLVSTAERLSSAARRGDVVARFGGEEFVWLLPDTDEPAAEALADRLLVALGGTPMQHGANATSDVWITGSLGVATEDGLIDGGRLVRSADRALYQAKELGRNRVEVAGPTGPQRPEPRLVRSRSASSPGPVWLADRLETLGEPSVNGQPVAAWTRLVAERLGLTDELESLVVAARLHQLADLRVGDVGDPALLLALTGDPAVAALVAGSRVPFDERSTPAGAQVIAVCAAWARLGSAGLHILGEGRGTRYDPAVLDVFLELVEEGHIPDRSGQAELLMPLAAGAG